MYIAYSFGFKHMATLMEREILMRPLTLSSTYHNELLQLLQSAKAVCSQISIKNHILTEIYTELICMFF